MQSLFKTITQAEFMEVEGRDNAASADVCAFELHLQQLYLYYRARRRRGQAVLVVSLAWACYNINVWARGWMESGGQSWFLLANTVASVVLAGACMKSTYRDSQLYVPHRYEDRSNGILAFLGLCFDGGSEQSLKRQSISPMPKQYRSLGGSLDGGGADGMGGRSRNR